MSFLFFSGYYETSKNNKIVKKKLTYFKRYEMR